MVVRRGSYGGEVAVSDKSRRVNNAGREPEPVVRREIPWTDGSRAGRRDDSVARESQRRSTAYGRARGRS